MKNIGNELLKICLLILLLIIGIFYLSYDQYEIIRFILIASFAWLVISEKDPNKKGWRFFYGVLIVLFNPFFKLDIGQDIWQIVDFCVATILLINLFDGNYGFHRLFYKIKKWNTRKYISLIFSKKVGNGLLKVLAITTVLFILYEIHVESKKKQEKQKAETLKHTQDSLAKIQHSIDSTNQINQDRSNKNQEWKTDSLKAIYCTEVNAIKFFKKHMDFYYPTWVLNKNIKIQDNGDCSYQISALVKDKRYDYGQGYDALIVVVRLWSNDYNMNAFDIIEKPQLFGD